MKNQRTKILTQELDSQLREVVHQAVAILGDVIRQELGEAAFRRIESLRERMTHLRGVGQNRSRSDQRESDRVLKQELTQLRRLSPSARFEMAHAYTLMLEVMNACENAYRTQIIRQRATPTVSGGKPNAIVYVLTAHPTEARAPENIWIFHEILRQLTSILERKDVTFTSNENQELRHALEIAWKTSIVRARKPRVEDEAEHIFSTLLRDETLRTLLRASQNVAPIYIRSWVGGDKDGHPGVDEKVFLDSLTLSRRKILVFISRRLSEVAETLQKVDAQKLKASPSQSLKKITTRLRKLKVLKAGDAKAIIGLRAELELFTLSYAKQIGSLHPSLQELKSLFHIFPALVVPLEFRESSDVLLSSPSGRGLAIYRMLEALARVSKGGDPRWYVRGFIISMASEIEHMRISAAMIKRALGDIKLPVIPLFEQAGALEKSSQIVKDVLADPKLMRALKKFWGGQLEVMLGYSDSSKESGVLKSRLLVAETMHRLDKLISTDRRAKNIVPVFFQGSGGSTDRGGGTVEEQTAWWSPSALRNYKVTIQGEMVERSLANPEITFGQVARIAQAAGRWSKASEHRLPHAPVLDAFAERVAHQYRTTVADPDFLRVIEFATPYRFLDLLRFGSRPTKRSKKVSVEGLRAIPWILCWTQTRILFPTWWGVGTAWRSTSQQDRRTIKKLAKTHPLFATYIRALGYTLAKVELPIWRVYLQASDLEPAQKEMTSLKFTEEFEGAREFLRAMTGSREMIAWRPWLAASIQLRSPMIHPLNLLQIIAMQTQDTALLRMSVAGISSGMMTTG